jgi:hypothetical protein
MTHLRKKASCVLQGIHDAPSYRNRFRFATLFFMFVVVLILMYLCNESIYVLLQPVVECHESSKLPPNTWPEADLLWRARCGHCQCLACSCTCVPSESLLFPRKKEQRSANSACHHARAINSRWRSTQEQINSHREVFVKFQHDLEQATHGFASCVICLDPFAVGDLLKQLPCNHCFHSTCISKWLAERSTCPVCQQCTNTKQPRTRVSGPRNRL